MLDLGLEFQYFSRNHQYFTSKITCESVYLEALLARAANVQQAYLAVVAGSLGWVAKLLVQW